jgi:hypothetical protein
MVVLAPQTSLSPARSIVVVMKYVALSSRVITPADGTGKSDLNLTKINLLAGKYDMASSGYDPIRAVRQNGKRVILTERNRATGTSVDGLGGSSRNGDSACTAVFNDELLANDTHRCWKRYREGAAGAVDAVIRCGYDWIRARLCGVCGSLTAAHGHGSSERRTSKRGKLRSVG